MKFEEDQSLFSFFSFCGCVYLLANEKVPYLIENKVLGELPFIIGDEWFVFKALQEGEE